MSVTLGPAYPRAMHSLTLLILALLVLIPSCSTPPPPEPPLGKSYWKGDSITGSPSVRIDLSDQRAYFYKGKELVGVSEVSTGREGLNTVTGNFHIIQKDKDHRSSLFGEYVDAEGHVLNANADTSKDIMPPGAHYVGANMPNFMRIVDGTGMHAGYLPGYPASHGCIRMPPLMAEAFFRSLKVGTPVTINP